MSVDQTKVVDFIGLDKNNGNVTLAITDHLEWNDSNEHLVILQDKINSYLSYIESGEILEKIPDANSRKITIEVHSKFEPNGDALRFMSQVKEIIEAAGFGFRFEQHRE